jgi:hypothetical protein
VDLESLLKVNSYPTISRFGRGTQGGRWQHLLGETRTHILLWYVLILGGVFLAGLPAFRFLLFQRVNAEIRQDIAAEMATFQEMITDESRFRHNIETHDRENYEDLLEYEWKTQSRVVPPSSLEDLHRTQSQLMDNQALDSANQEVMKLGQTLQPMLQAMDEHIIRTVDYLQCLPEGLASVPGNALELLPGIPGTDKDRSINSLGQELPKGLAG